MKHLDLHKQLFILFTIIVFSSWCVPATGQVDPVVLDLRNRLVENRNADYVEARDEALALPDAAFADLLFLLRLSPEYSLDQILALILEARAAHPEESARFDHDRQHSLDNPDMTGRHGRPIYRPWTTREPKELHPLVYEAMIKFDRSGPVSGMVSMPNPDNIPFILYFAKHQSLGALSWLVTATKGYPEEREWLRPLAVQMYKEHREQGDVIGAGAIVGMFRWFGTPHDLEILNDLREFEQEKMPQQGIVIGDWDEIGQTFHAANREYEQKKTDLARAEREGAAPLVIQQRQQELELAETVAREAERQFIGNSLWRQLNNHIQGLKAQLEPVEQDD